MLIGGALLAGCQTQGSQPDQVQTAQFDLDAWRNLGLEIDWSVAGRNGASIESIDPEGDVLITVDRRSVLTVREDDTGAIRWSIQVTSPTEQFYNAIRVPNYEFVSRDGNSIAADAILVVSATEIFAFDLTSGSLIERYTDKQTTSTPGVVLYDRIITGTATGKVNCKRLLNGVNKWSYNLEGAVQGKPVVMDSGRVGLVSAGGEVLIVNGLDGESKEGPIKIFGGVETSPVTDGRTLFVASLDHSIYAFDSISTNRRWRVRTQAPLLYQPTVFDGSLFVTTEKGLTAYSTRNGDELWSVAGVDGEVVSTVRGDLLVATDNELVLVDPTTGGVVDRIDSGGYTSFRADGFEDADIYATGRSGAIAKFTVR